ncbi:hypothetical protein ACPCUV_11555 [Streptomyces platensis]|uniref:hypothetical protein n=1 Tax=Streptomyces platensis TaxID=58346 RepID=UPI003C2D3E9D
MSADEFVQTPYGPVPRSEVVEVNENETVKVVDGHLKRCEAGTGRVVEDLGAVSEEALAADPYVYAAGLRGRRAVPRKGGDAAQKSNGHFAADWSQANIQSFVTTWKVPAKPNGQDGGNVFFLWNGLAGGALQPVLDWRNGSDVSYGIANWAYVGKYIHGGHLTGIDPGTPLTGVIDFLRKDSSGYTYKVGFEGYPQVDLTVVRSTEATGVCLCFEPYGGARPPDPEVKFTDIVLSNRSTTIDWSGMQPVDNSSAHGEVDCVI